MWGIRRTTSSATTAAATFAAVTHFTLLWLRPRNTSPPVFGFTIFAQTTLNNKTLRSCARPSVLTENFRIEKRKDFFPSLFKTRRMKWPKKWSDNSRSTGRQENIQVFRRRRENGDGATFTIIPLLLDASAGGSKSNSHKKKKLSLRMLVFYSSLNWAENF